MVLVLARIVDCGRRAGLAGSTRIGVAGCDALGTRHTELVTAVSITATRGHAATECLLRRISLTLLVLRRARKTRAVGHASAVLTNKVGGACGQSCCSAGITEIHALAAYALFTRQAGNAVATADTSAVHASLICTAIGGSTGCVHTEVVHAKLTRRTPRELAPGYTRGNASALVAGVSRLAEIVSVINGAVAVIVNCVARLVLAREDWVARRGCVGVRDA